MLKNALVSVNLGFGCVKNFRLRRANRVSHSWNLYRNLHSHSSTSMNWAESIRQTNGNYVEHRFLELNDNFLVFKIVDTILLSLMYSKCGYDTYCNSEQTLIGVRIFFIIGIMRWVVGHAIRNVMSVYSVLLEVSVRNSKREPGHRFRVRWTAWIIIAIH